MSLALLLSACAPRTRVVLLPQADGTASAVVVKSGTNELVLNKPYQRATGQGENALKADTLTAADVQQSYRVLFTAAPPRSTKYVLYFLTGGTTLTPESEALLPKVLADVAARRGADLVVTGHTDTMGALLANDELSLRRARLVTQLLVEKGAPDSRIESVGRGKRELLVNTADEVDEPQNRRVEIVVR